VVVSSRRLLVDAVGALIDERLEVDRVAATSANDLRAAVDADRAILVIIDLESPGDDPVRLAEALADHTGRRCGVYDRFTARIAERAFDLGIGVPVSLRSPVDSLLDAFGGTTVTNVVTAVGPTRRDLDRLAELSPRELEVMEHIARGDTSVRTAALLGITPHTVDTHRRRAIRKLGASNQSQAVALLARVGALTTPRGGRVSARDRADDLHRPS
jgi:DNA-binding CsgD family transcriptional regulator